MHRRSRLVWEDFSIAEIPYSAFELSFRGGIIEVIHSLMEQKAFKYSTLILISKIRGRFLLKNSTCCRFKCEVFGDSGEVFGAYCEVFGAYCEVFGEYCEVFGEVIHSRALPYRASPSKVKSSGVYTPRGLRVSHTGAFSPPFLPMVAQNRS